MKNKLYQYSKIEIRKSSIHGYGVFAKEDLKNGELLEECHHIRTTLLQNQDCDCKKKYPYKKYQYNYPYNKTYDENKPFQYETLVLGYGSIYNSSISDGENNAEFDTDLDNNIFIFRTIKDIKKDQEILIYYGDNWWQHHK